MNLLLHQRFLNSWRRLVEPDKAAVVRLVTMLRDGSVTSGMRPHRVGAFQSFSPNMDVRLLATISGDTTTLVYVDHHDAAYQWARNTRLLAAGIGQTELVDVTALIESSVLPPSDTALPLPIQDVVAIDDDEVFLRAILDLSPEWREWLWSSRVGETASPPDTSSLVYTPQDDADLLRALTLDTADWLLFLHPSQRAALDDQTHTSIALTGGPGTGKTVVLLNRLLARSAKIRGTDCVVLITSTQILAWHLLALIRTRSNQNLHIFARSILTQGQPGSPPSKVKREASEFRLVIEDDGEVVCVGPNSRQRVRELLVDEAQDLELNSMALLRNVTAAGRTTVLLAADQNQITLTKNRQALASWVATCAVHYGLTYSYRSTRQILLQSNAWLLAHGLGELLPQRYGLSGPRVRFLPCAEMNEGMAIAVETIRDLEQRYPRSRLALIYGQYHDPGFRYRRGVDREEQAIKYHPEFKDLYWFAPMTKGREYLAGVVLVATEFMMRDLGPEENALRVKTLYVALTRFRDELTVIYVEGSPAGRMLHQMAGG